MGFLRFKNHGQGITGSASVLLSKRLLSPMRAKTTWTKWPASTLHGFSHRFLEATSVRLPVLALNVSASPNSLTLGPIPHLCRVALSVSLFSACLRFGSTSLGLLLRHPSTHTAGTALRSLGQCLFSTDRTLRDRVSFAFSSCTSASFTVYPSWDCCRSVRLHPVLRHPEPLFQGVYMLPDVAVLPRSTEYLLADLRIPIDCRIFSAAP